MDFGKKKLNANRFQSVSISSRLMMFQQTIVYTCTSLLLIISYSFAEQYHFVSEQCPCDTKNTDQANLSDHNNKQCYKYAELYNLINLPLLSIIFAQSEYLPNGQCKEDARQFIKELQNGTLWAVQMFDSSSKYPDGILYGNTRHLGNFDECYNLQVNIRKKDIDTKKITGRYCLVDLKYEKKDKSEVSHKSSILDFDPNESFWEAIEERRNFLRIRRYFLQLAMCVPSSCSPKDIETALQKPLEEINANNNIEMQVAVQTNFCQTVEEEPKFTFAAKVYCIIVLGLLFLIIISTYYDVTLSSDKRNISTFQNIILCFSFRRNFKDIFYVNYSQSIDSIHFIRLFMTILISMLHRSFQYGANPTINLIYLEKVLVLPMFTFVSNGGIMNDMYLAISAILVTYHLLEDLDRRKRLSFIKNVILRYLRLTPSYVIVIFFYAWIFPLLGSGPFWKQEVEQEAAQCATNWWTNLLYINNYVKPTKTCMFQSWYVSVDFQLFILSQFIIYAFWRMPRKIGHLFLGTVTIISCIIPFFATYLYGVFPVFRPTPLLHSVRDVPFFSSHFVKTHMRFTGYLVGIIAGAIIHDYKRITWQMPKFWSHILVLPLPITLITVFQLWSYRFFIPYFDTSVLESALYASFQRLVSAFCICIIIVTLSIGQLKFYHNLVTMRWVQPLARLTYGVFLVGDIFHAYNQGRARSARMFSWFILIWEIIPDAIFSYMVSLFLTLCVEEPFRKLAKQFFPKDNKKVNERYVQ